MTVSSDENLVNTFSLQIRQLLHERPALEPPEYYIFLKSFDRSEEFIIPQRESALFTNEQTQYSYERLLNKLERASLGWGIHKEFRFPEDMTALLEASFQAKVESYLIKNEPFSRMIFNDHHILVELTDWAALSTAWRLQQKWKLYEVETGIKPACYIFAVPTIQDQQMETLRDAGFEVIEPEE